MSDAPHDHEDPQVSDLVVGSSAFPVAPTQCVLAKPELPLVEWAARIPQAEC